MNTELKEKDLTTSDLAAPAETRTAQPDVDRDVNESVTENQGLAAPAETRTAQPDVHRAVTESVTENRRAEVMNDDEQLAPLFSADAAKEFRSRWDAVQSSFVDDPKQAVRKGDELVAQVMKSLTETFSNERSRLEGQRDQSDKASTENLRVALRRYRSFFERLLSL